MISDWVARYTHTHTQQHGSQNSENCQSPYCFNLTYNSFQELAAICRHEPCKRSYYNQVLLVHVDVVHTPGTCDDL